MLRAISVIPEYIGSYTYATLPAASAALSGFRAFVSDWGANGTDARCNGTRWLPANGQALMKRAAAAGVSGIANSETIIDKAQFPVGALQAGDTILIRLSLSKSGTTDTAQLSVRVGTAGTTSDTALTGLSATQALGASAQSAGMIYAARVLSTTSMQRIGANGNVSGYGGSNATASAAATTGLPDSSSNAIYVTVTVKSSSTNDTVGWQGMSIIHEAG